MKWADLENILTRAMQPLKNRVLSMIGRALIKAVDDSQGIQLVQVSALAGENMDKVPRFQEFGFTSNPPEGSEAVLLAVGGTRENVLIVATDKRSVRKLNLASGEAAIYTANGTFVHVKMNGEVHIKGATKVKLETATTEITGNVTVAGNINCAGNVFGGNTDMATIKSNYNSHTHSDPQGGSVSTPSNNV